VLPVVVVPVVVLPVVVVPVVVLPVVPLVVGVIDVPVPVVLLPGTGVPLCCINASFRLNTSVHCVENWEDDKELELLDRELILCPDVTLVSSGAVESPGSVSALVISAVSLLSSSAPQDTASEMESITRIRAANAAMSGELWELSIFFNSPCIVLSLTLL
jgi:hypothetical protein